MLPLHAHVWRDGATLTPIYVLQVYNEVIYDLLARNSGPLELREDPTAGPCVAGLKRVTVHSAVEIMVSPPCLLRGDVCCGDVAVQGVQASM